MAAMARYTIRRLEPDDHTSLRAVRLRALAGEPTAFGSTLADALTYGEEHWRARLAPDAHPHFGAFDPTGAMAGMAVGLDEGADGGGAADLVGMWVDPELRGTGAAADLVGEVIRWAVGRGFMVVRLWVTEGNERAIGLYRKLGFVFTGERDVRERDGLTELQMELVL